MTVSRPGGAITCKWRGNGDRSSSLEDARQCCQQNRCALYHGATSARLRIWGLILQILFLNWSPYYFQKRIMTVPNGKIIKIIIC